MMNPSTTKQLIMASLLPLMLSPAVAQDAATDEIVVTARPADGSGALKMQLPLIDVPQSLSITNSLEIKQRGFRELGDIVRYTPGINTSQGEGHRDSIVFRGVRSTADFFLDGVRDDVQYYRPLYNIEQVEVLRGPNALLFGRGGTGGAVNRVTKKAVIGKAMNEVDAGIDSFGAYNLAADVNMVTGETSALRVNAFVETLENDRDFYDGDRFGINPTLRVALDGNTKLDLSYELMDHERFIDRGIPTGADGAPVDALRDIVFGSATDNTTTLEANVLRGSVTRKFSDTRTSVVSLTYGDYEKMYQNLYAAGYSADDETVTLDGYRDPTERTNMVLSGYITDELMAGGIRHTILVGGEYIDTESDNLRYDTRWTNPDDASKPDRQTFDLPTSGNNLNLALSAAGSSTAVNFHTALNRRTETEIAVTSLFIQDQLAVTGNLQVLLGARLDNFDITVNDTKPGASDAKLSREDEEVSTRFGLIYKPEASVSFYASLSESFQPRSGEQYKNLTDNSAATTDPDIFENTEFGVKWDVSDSLNVAASFFENEQERARSDGEGGGYVQGLSVDGYEVEVKGGLTHKTSIAFGYTSLDGETAGGDTPRELPETMYSVFVEHQANDRLNFGIGLTYQDESLIKDGSTAYLPDYTRIDASLSYIVSDEMTVRVNVENLADEEYYPHAHSTHQASVGDPINAQISVSRKF